MSATPPQGIAGNVPAMTLHAYGIALGQFDEHAAQLVLHNPVMHAEVKLTREALQQLGGRMLALADELTDAPAAAQLVLPDSAGGLVGPDGGRL